jgi:hypothetical protein
VAAGAALLAEDQGHLLASEFDDGSDFFQHDYPYPKICNGSIVP